MGIPIRVGMLAARREPDGKGLRRVVDISWAGIHVSDGRGGSVNHPEPEFRAKYELVRPADTDAAAWALFLPDGPLPDTGPKVFRTGQIWVSRIDSSYASPGTVFRFNADGDRTVLAGSSWAAPADGEAQTARHAVLLFDVPAEKVADWRACDSCQKAPCRCPETKPVSLPTRSGPHLKPEVGMAVDYVRTSDGTELYSTPWRVVPDGSERSSATVAIWELQDNAAWDNGQYDILSTPPSPVPAPDVWRVGQRRRGGDFSIRDGKDFDFSVLRAHQTIRNTWKVKDQDGTEWSFHESWPSTLIADAPSQPQQPAPVSGCREPGWRGRKYGDDDVPEEPAVAPPVLNGTRDLNEPAYCSTACQSAKGGKPAHACKDPGRCGKVEHAGPWQKPYCSEACRAAKAAAAVPAPAHVCKGRPCGEMVVNVPESWRDGGWWKDDNGIRRGFCSSECRHAWKPQPSPEAVKPAWKCEGCGSSEQFAPDTCLCADCDKALVAANKAAARRAEAFSPLATFHAFGDTPPVFNGIRRPVDPRSPVLSSGWHTYEDDL